jgi:hypothetical protein
LAGATNPHKPFLFTEEQDIKILVDQAIFSDSMAARTRAVNQLALNYGMKAMPALKDILSSIPSGEDVFRAFCVNAISKLWQSEERAVDERTAFREKS